MDDVWDGVVVNQETIIKRAWLLREAIGDDSKNPEVIESVRGIGYRLIPEVELLTATSTSKRRPKFWWLFTGCATLLVAAFLFYSSINWDPPPAKPASAERRRFAAVSKVIGRASERVKCAHRSTFQWWQQPKGSIEVASTLP